MEEKILQEYIKNITKASTYFIFKNGPVKKLQEEGKLTAEEVKEMQVYMQNHLAYLYNVLLEENNLNEINCKVFDDFFSHNFIAKVSEVEDFYFAIVEEKRDLISV